MKCGDCKYFVSDIEHMDDLGEEETFCQRVFDCHTQYLARTEAAGHYISVLVVHEDFGCVMFEEKIRMDF